MGGAMRAAERRRADPWGYVAAAVEDDAAALHQPDACRPGLWQGDALCDEGIRGLRPGPGCEPTADQAARLRDLREAL